ncbi:hypothetical protein TRVL_07162 [Trypanosoma vivax]|nr:hypothetical protein TRVL_07162 [Trypanosoma vivax]
MGDAKARASRTQSCTEQLGQPWHKKHFEAHCAANSVRRGAVAASDWPASPSNSARTIASKDGLPLPKLGDKRKTCGVVFVLTPRSPAMPKLRGSVGKHRKHTPKPLVCALLRLPKPLPISP